MSRLDIITKRFFSLLVGLLLNNSSAYIFLMGALFFVFVILRFPFVFSLEGFGLSLVYIIGALFVSVVIFCVLSFPVSFFLQFLPYGTPLWMSGIICWLEAISFCIRPLVLILRPLVNLSLGLMVTEVLVYNSFSLDYVPVAWLLWLFYEAFVCVVQWFIVNLILQFTGTV